MTEIFRPLRQVFDLPPPRPGEDFDIVPTILANPPRNGEGDHAKHGGGAERLAAGALVSKDISRPLRRSATPPRSGEDFLSAAYSPPRNGEVAARSADGGAERVEF